MNKTTLYREFQKSCSDLVKTEAVMYGISEYSVDIRRQSTKITLYVRSYSVSLTFYIRGKVVIERNIGESEILSSSRYEPYCSGKCTLPQLLGDLVYDLFDRSLLIKAKYDEDRRERAKHKKSLAAVSETEV